MIRHSRICLADQAVRSRQKSCDSCTIAKSKCDLQWPACHRCRSRTRLCTYKNSICTTVHADSGRIVVTGSVTEAEPEQQSPPLEFPSGIVDYGSAERAPIPRLTLDNVSVDAALPASISGLNEVAYASSFTTIMAHFAARRDGENDADNNEQLMLNPTAWLQKINPVRTPLGPAQQRGIEFCLQVLRTWPQMLSNKFQNPPIFHNTQISDENMAEPLANCCSIARMWHDQRGRNMSLVHETTIREMTKLFHTVCCMHRY